MKTVKTVKFLLKPLDEDNFREFQRILAEYKIHLLYWYRKLNYKVLKKADRTTVHRIIYHRLPKNWSSGLKASLTNQLVEFINLSAVQKKRLIPRLNIRLHKAAWKIDNDIIIVKYGARGKSTKFKLHGNSQRLKILLKEARIGEPTIAQKNSKLYLCIPLVKRINIPRLNDYEPPLLLAASDINSLHGFTTTFVLFKNWDEYEVLDTVRAKPKSITSRFKALRFYQSRKCESRVKQIWNNIKNQRRDSVEKLSYEIVEKTLKLAERYRATPVIIFEDLSGWNEKSLKKMLRDKGYRGKMLKWLAQNINSTLRGVAKRTEQKALWHGIRTIYVSAKGTSKYCHICGARLKQVSNGRYRVMRCRNKHFVERDFNAAVNIAIKAVKLILKLKTSNL